MAVRNRRLKNYWEPIHDPQTPDTFKQHPWEFQNDKGPAYCTFDLTVPNETVVYNGITFTNCDFENNNKAFIIFKECKFIKCDFGLAKFKSAKFTNCGFEKSSFTQSSFIDCEFRECSFSEIGISGNSTILEKTLITNPGSFIKSATTNLDYLPSGKTISEQVYKLEETKSTLSRILLHNLSREGSEESFYEAVKTNGLQECRARVVKNKYFTINTPKKFGTIKSVIWRSRFGAATALSLIDYAISFAFGTVNAWGASIARPVIIGALIVISFAFAYQHVLDISFSNAARRSIEIMLLFGYTSYSTSASPSPESWVNLANAILGVAWYVITVPTVVNRLTRVRTS